MTDQPFGASLKCMSTWDKRYHDAEGEGFPEPCKTLVDFLPLLPKGRALDIACGSGRNGLFLAKNGWEVDAADASVVALRQGEAAAKKCGASVNFIEADLEAYSIEAESYDLIINFNYLDRKLIPEIVKGLKIGGAVLFETFTVHQREFGPPRNPAYLLDENELLRLFGGLHVACYREGVFGEGGSRKAVASLLAFKKK